MHSCSHITTIQQNDVTLKDQLIGTYNSIKSVITHRASFSPSQRLPLMTCQTCHGINNGSTFLCLQCSFSGCWNGKHFNDHSNDLNHSFAINSSNGLLFCFKCMDYINDIESINDSYVAKQWDIIEKQTHIPDERRKDGLYGLVNMGSTCFMSSVIQSLVHNKYILNSFLSQEHYNSCPIRDSRKCMSCTLDQIIAESYGSISEKNDHHGFLSLLICSWSIKNDYAGYSQQDAHEFLQFILNQLHQDYVKTHDGKKDSNCPCIIHSTFQGSLKSSIVCSECHDSSKTIIEPYLDLSLDIKNKTNLYECLDSFHRKEKLQDFNYHCSKCQTSKDPIKQLTINTLPPVLVLQLKRFEHLMNGNSVKLNDFIKFPLYLDMGSYCLDDSDSQNSDPNNIDAPHILYELIGIISHQGSVDKGHYTCVLKLNSDQWFKFNDSMISLLTEEEVLRERAYLLFFSVKHIM